MPALLLVLAVVGSVVTILSIWGYIRNYKNDQLKNLFGRVALFGFLFSMFTGVWSSVSQTASELDSTSQTSESKETDSSKSESVVASESKASSESVATSESKASSESVAASESKASSESVAASESEAKASSEASKESEQKDKLSSMSFAGYDGNQFLKALEDGGVKNIDIDKITFESDGSGASFDYPVKNSKYGETYNVLVKSDGTVSTLNNPTLTKKMKKIAEDAVPYAEVAANKIFESQGMTFKAHAILSGYYASYDETTNEFEAQFDGAEIKVGDVSYKHQEIVIRYTLDGNKLNKDNPMTGLNVVSIQRNGVDMY